MALDISAIELNYDILHRFEEIIKPLFRRAFNSPRIDLVAPVQDKLNMDDPYARATAKEHAIFDERQRRLVVPLGAQNQVLALLVVWEVSAEQLLPAVTPFLSSLVDASLDLVRMRLANETDPVTGLANDLGLDEALINAISRLSPRQFRGRPALDDASERSGLTLLVAEPVSMPLILDKYGRRFGERLLSELTRKVKHNLSDYLSLARIGWSILILINGGAAQALEVGRRLERIMANLELPVDAEHNWTGKLRMGAALLALQDWEGSNAASEAAVQLKVKAMRALSAAARISQDELLFFNEILDKAGRVRELLPLDRVLVDLGHIHGLTEGERFQVVAEKPEGNAQPKAEVLITSVGEEEAVAEISVLFDPTWVMRSGDRLLRMGPESSQAIDNHLEQTITLGQRELRIIIDDVTGLANHRSFMEMFSQICMQESTFSVALVRADGLDLMREVSGRVAVDTLMARLASILKETFDPEQILGRYAPDTFGVIVSGAAPHILRNTALQMMDCCQQADGQALRAGVAFYPCPGFNASDALDNASKALVHAGFMEPYSVVIFDAVSLNISGDVLYNQGRISEAIAEYELALGLAPHEPNVLNSLGVCHGHMGSMDKALEYFNRALLAAPDDHMAYYNLGQTLMGQGNLAEAKIRLEQSLNLAPDHADTLFQLGQLAQRQGQWREAADLYGQARALPGCRQSVYRHLGEIYALQGKTAEAEEAFKQALRHQGNDASALNGLAGIYLDRNANLEIALSLSRRAAELEPQNSRPLRAIAQILLALGQAHQAAEVLNKAIDSFPEDPFLAVQMARTWQALNNQDNARLEYERALALEPNLSIAQDGLKQLL